ncbi:MAG: patatin-like phospholipase family protein [Bacteroidota bacterium]
MNRYFIHIIFLCFFFFPAGKAFSQKTGLVLSGGGAAGLSHIGVLKALEENGIPVDYITGTSSGALVGGMYAAGYSPEEIEALVTSEKFLLMSEGKVEPKYIFYFKEPLPNPAMISLRVSKDSIRQTALPTNLVSPILLDYEMMSGLSGAAAKAGYDFDSLFVPFRCVASDIADKKSVVFSEGQLHEAVRASMSYPFYIKPLTVDGKLLFDGGLYNNFPSNVMYDEFLPDVMIGSNVSGTVLPPTEDNIMSQIKNMIITRQDYAIRCENGIIIQPQTSVGTFEFTSLKEVIDAGYNEAMKNMDSIKTLVGDRRVTKEVIEAKRKKFRESCPPLVINKIEITGLKKNEQLFVKKTLVKKKEKFITEEELKPRYFRIYNDEKIGFMYPKMYYNDSLKYYKLKLEIKKEKEINAEFGGNFSSRPINTGYVGVNFHLLRKSAWTFSANSHFGKFYAAAHAAVKYEPPSKVPVYFEPEFTMHRWDYFKSFATFFEDIKPSYIIQYEQYAGFNIGIPVKNKGRLISQTRYTEQYDDYYQTDQFTSLDTADQTNMFSVSSGLVYERSTLNKKVYANEGTYLYIGGRFVNALEISTPGSTSLVRDTTRKFHNWGIIKIEYQNYFKRRGIFRFGGHLEGVYSIQPFLNNYTATVLSIPAYQPIPESRTLFMTDYRANQYISGGLQTIIHFVKNFDWRIEGYAFQPLSVLYADPDNKPYYGEPLQKRYFIGSTSLVYHSPVGPLSVSLNYYPNQEREYSLLFNFGYIIFNRYALK